MQTNPAILGQSGMPTCYREFTDTDNSRRIQFYPSPNVDTPLFIVGKRTLTQLIELSDESIIRGIDSVLFAFAHHDLLRRQKQYGKAQTVLEEANALLQAAQNAETNQANKPRRSNQLTVAGNSLSELTYAVADRTGMWSLTDISSIKAAIRRNYQRAYDACNWAESTVIARVNNDGSEVILPVYFDRVISIRTDDGNYGIDAINASLPFQIAPGIFEQTGTPVAFSYLTSVGVKLLPQTREKLSFVSTAVADTSTVFIMGESLGSEVSETITLAGLQPVSTRNTYDVPITVAKQLTTGIVTVTGVTTGDTLQTLSPSERERKHMRLWLKPTPSSAKVCLVLGKRKIKPLVTDEDTPILRNIQNVLINAAVADMLDRTGKGADARKQADSDLKIMVDLETSQGAFTATVVPDADGYCDYSPSKYYV